MTVLDIAKDQETILHRRAEAVSDPTAPEIRRLVADMVETMHHAGGVGLAAPQVYQPLRLFVYMLPRARAEAEGAEPVAPQVLINPVLEPAGPEKIIMREACLSLPDRWALVPRYAAVHYKGTDTLGQEVAGVAKGFLARVLQHEYDHLEGTLYPARAVTPEETIEPLRHEESPTLEDQEP